jgi:UMF1 family MFS transporter
MAASQMPKSIWRRTVLAWCLYDWANSAYTTLMISVLVVYVQRIVFPEQVWGTTGAVVWAWSVSGAMLAGGILSPILGAAADLWEGKRIGFALSALSGGGACLAMALVPPSQPWLVVACFVLATLGLELSLTFYNGFLPEVAADDELNRVSALGMALGYLGGGIALILAMVLLQNGQAWGLGDGATLLRICIFFTGVWWMGFSIPTLLVLRDRPRGKPPGRQSPVAFVVRDIGGTLKHLIGYRTLALFLIAYLFYNDGVQTLISQTPTFALRELNFTNPEMAGVILLVQFVAMPGAILVGWLSDRIGQKQTLVLCLLVWIVLLASAWFVHNKFAFWLLAAGVALVLGGTQSVSRAIMSLLAPQGQEARYFGFFNLSGKATSFLGTFFFGLIIALTGSARLAIVNLLVFFIIGLWLITRINLQRGLDERAQAVLDARPKDSSNSPALNRTH